MRKGMTLIEILVVLAILGILVALLAWRTGAIYHHAQDESHEVMVMMVRESKKRAELDGLSPTSVQDLIQAGYLSDSFEKNAKDYAAVFWEQSDEKT